jgi:hypothetical protein
MFATVRHGMSVTGFPPQGVSRRVSVTGSQPQGFRHTVHYTSVQDSRGAHAQDPRLGALTSWKYISYTTQSVHAQKPKLGDLPSWKYISFTTQSVNTQGYPTVGILAQGIPFCRVSLLMVSKTTGFLVQNLHYRASFLRGSPKLQHRHAEGILHYAN